MKLNLAIEALELSLEEIRKTENLKRLAEVNYTQIVKILSKLNLVKDIAEFPGYKIDYFGNVYSCWKTLPIHAKGKAGSLGSKRIKSDVWRRKAVRLINSGYLIVGFQTMKSGIRKMNNRLIHRLLLTAFISEQPDGFDGCHNDGNRLNNKVYNLRWDTRKNNHADKLLHGTKLSGEKCYMAKLSEKQVRVIKYLIKAGVKNVTIGKYFKQTNVSQISSIKIGLTWKHVVID